MGRFLGKRIASYRQNTQGDEAIASGRSLQVDTGNLNGYVCLCSVLCGVRLAIEAEHTSFDE